MDWYNSDVKKIANYLGIRLGLDFRFGRHIIPIVILGW